MKDVNYLTDLVKSLIMCLNAFSCSNSDLVISAQRVDGPESFLIEIEKSKVDGLLQEFDGDMGFMAQFLRL